MKKQVIAVIHGNDGSDVRIGKVCRSLSRQEFDVYFVGWNRRPNEQVEIDLGDTNRVIMKRGTEYGRATLFGYLSFLWFVIRSLLRIRPAVACAVNEDMAFFLIPFRRLLYRKLVCDIFDSLSYRYNHRAFPLAASAKFVTWWARQLSDHLVVTDENRYRRLGRFSSKATIIENVPEDPGEALAQTQPEGCLKVLVSGTLTENRGLKQILESIESIPGARIICVGWPYDDVANRFIDEPCVDYRGVVTLHQSLELAAQCDAVYAFYSPHTVNNRNASPNKIFDAMSVGRPVILNSEIVSATWVVDNEIGFVCPYDDRQALRTTLKKIHGARGKRTDMNQKARKLFLDRHTWEIMETRLLELYRDLVES